MYQTILPPLSLYVHIPWCIRKCPYCDFNSHSASDKLPEADYVAALLTDLSESQGVAQGRKLRSVFIGGGTPSLFSPQAIDTILTAANRYIGFENNIEITLEANPGTAEQEKFTGFYRAGINRLSIGVQSFQPQHLTQLGRIHDSHEALRAVDLARAAGFENINIDLMHGLPGQTSGEALADLKQAISLTPQHISWYQLTIEPNTAFYKQPPILPSDDVLADIQDGGQRHLDSTPYHHYEVSAYALAGYRSAHNVNYWQFGDYLGIGAGAHGKITQKESPNGPSTIVRFWKTRQPSHYLSPAKPFTAGRKYLQIDDLLCEFMMNALRLFDGVPNSLFTERTGLPLSTIESKLNQLQQKGLMSKQMHRMQATPLGQRFLNTVLAEFMPSP